MKLKIKVEKEVELYIIQVQANVRYWEDSSMNSIKTSEDGEGFPCKEGNNWSPTISIDDGKIINWKKGIKATTHFKVCDLCTYKVIDDSDAIVLHREGYVPDVLCPEDKGYGDYMIMSIDENGYISNWDKSKIIDLFDEE